MRTYAMVFCSIWADQDYRALSLAGQWLYLNRLTSPTLTNVGSADWRPKRIAALADGVDVQFVEAAGAELAATRFAVIDDDTEEILLRSFVRWDGLLKKPNVAIAMTKAHAALASPTLRQVVVHELRRLREEQPDLVAWEHRDSRVQIGEILAQDAVDARDLTPWTPDWMGEWTGLADALSRGSANPSVKGSGNPSGNRSGKGSVDPSGEGSVNGSAKGSAKDCLTPSPSPNPTTLNQQPSETADAVSGRQSRPRRVERPKSTDPEARAVAAQDPEKTRANVLIGKWIDPMDERPPGNVVGQVAKYVRGFLLEGASEADVLATLEEFQALSATKSITPSVLPSLLHGIRSRRAAPRPGQPGGAPLSDAELRDRALNPHLYAVPTAGQTAAVPA